MNFVEGGSCIYRLGHNHGICSMLLRRLDGENQALTFNCGLDRDTAGTPQFEISSVRLTGASQIAKIFLLASFAG